ncbi:hypothetical protein Poli38472_000987 [Pythium oligandrum]|uniref:EF-hand domain-containing protein n=1 Tax=Pythium oligandrum TaxID=41045 RepID=A0A8K1FEV2_PYTOL|nr:hypothetical protein Poli38472_000987 [Pythium oligandrum]|eukprot:TMW60945.1 hypothetical protein Poli38472_000987 [Pythium oligandrum]
MPDGNEHNGSLFHVGDNVELWRVLMHLCIVVFFIIVFEQCLHYGGHHIRRYPKYHEMMTKVFGELMILGFISLGIKILKDVSHLNANGKPIIAFQAADIMVFILAIALIVQAVSIYVNLRSKNIQAAKAELISSAHLVIMIKEEQQKKKTLMSRVCALIPTHWFHRVRHIDKTTITPRDYTQITEARILRHFFLKTYKLPDLFPFSKYLRHAQDNQINHMIEVEISTWIILLLLGWVMMVVADLFEKHLTTMEEHLAVVAAFLVLSWLAVALHLVIYIYFWWAIRKLLETASGYMNATDKDLFAKLQEIAEAETLAVGQEVVADAIAVMLRVREAEQARIVKRRRNHLMKHDTGFQLVAMAWRNASLRLRMGKSSGTDSPVSSDAIAYSYDTEAGENWTSIPDPQLSSAHPSQFHIPFFSRKAWHFVVMSTLMLNGFYFALFCQCVMYQLGRIADHFGLAAAVFIPLPLIVNMLVFQPRILRNFILVSSIHRVDDTAMGEVIDLFTETMELRAEFVQCVNDHLEQSGQTLEDVHMEFLQLDVTKTGKVDVDDVRIVIGRFGFRLSFFRFNSVARLLFHLEGTQVEYNQVLKLLSLGRFRCMEPTSVDSKGDGYANASGSSRAICSPSHNRHVPFVRQASSTNLNPVLQRANSRVLRSFYRMDLSPDESEHRDESTYHFVRM